MLVLTSFGFRSPLIRGKLSGVLPVKGKTVLILPFAGVNIKACAEHESEGLVRFGYSPENIFICEDLHTLTRLNYDVIYVPGGNTFKLLKTVQNKGLMLALRKAAGNGCTYIGVSAGAELATVDLQYVENLEENNEAVTDFHGLGLIKDVVIPHSDQRNIADQLACKSNAGKTRKLLCIPNDGVIIYDILKEQCNVKYL